jgi:hypothetical protein
MRQNGKHSVGNIKPNGPSAPRILRARDREAQALQLRKAGLTLDVIASRLGYANRSGVSKAIGRATERHTSIAVDELRDLEAQRYDDAQASIWARVLQGDDNAIASFMRISAGRRKLLGLDAPSKREHTFHDEVRNMCDRIADELGMDPAIALAEAERFMGKQD